MGVRLKILKIVLVSSILFLQLISCKNSPVEASLQPGRRDYVWTEDTLKTKESLYLTRIWGSSPNDVWAIGTSSSTATSIWHYNGKQWRCDSISRSVQPYAIYGFSNFEVWLGNLNSTIWKFDGLRWLEYGEYKINGFDNIWFLNFAGLYPNDIYGIGCANLKSGDEYKGIIIHYDGNSWKFINIPSVKVEFSAITIDQSSKSLIIEGVVFDPSGYINKIYVWNGKELKELYSGYAYASVSSIQNQPYISIDGKIYKFMSSQLSLWKDLSMYGASGKIWGGRSESDFFINSYQGIGNYNGIDYKTIYKTDLNFSGGYIFENEVFFITNDINKTGNSIVIHGILK